MPQTGIEGIGDLKTLRNGGFQSFFLRTCSKRVQKNIVFLSIKFLLILTDPYIIFVLLYHRSM